MAGALDDDVRARLAPLLGRIAASECFVVTGDGFVTVMSHTLPDGPELERRIALAGLTPRALAG